MKKYRIRVRESQGMKSWFVPGVGGVKKLCYGEERTHLAYDDKDEALKLAGRMARCNQFLWVKVMYGDEKVWERKP